MKEVGAVWVEVGVSSWILKLRWSVLVRGELSSSRKRARGRCETQGPHKDPEDALPAFETRRRSLEKVWHLRSQLESYLP